MTAQPVVHRQHVEIEADRLDDEFRRTSHLLLDLDRFTERIRAADSRDDRLKRLDATLLSAWVHLDDLLSQAAR